jgi:hydroxymethylbilane synthase
VVPAARFQPIRGNVDTRVRKLDDGQFDALVLAAAGLRRLGLHSRISSLIPLEVCIPSPGQGTIVIETRTDDAARAVVGAVNDGDAMTCLVAERAVVSRLGGECQMPIGATASVERGILTLRCIVAAPDGSRAARSQVQGPATLAQDLGVEAAVHLLAAGGDQILQALRERRDRT